MFFKQYLAADPWSPQSDIKPAVLTLYYIVSKCIPLQYYTGIRIVYRMHTYTLFMLLC